MAETLTEPRTKKRNIVLQALRAGKTVAEAAAEASCTYQYASDLAKQCPPAADVPEQIKPSKATEEEMIEALRTTPDVAPLQVLHEEWHPTAPQVARTIWPCVLERVAQRLYRNDERFATAAEDAHQAADCFMLKVKREPPEIVELALLIWPTIWRDYAKRGRTIPNFQLAAESADMAVNAAKAFLDHSKKNDG